MGCYSKKCVRTQLNDNNAGGTHLLEGVVYDDRVFSDSLALLILSAVRERTGVARAAQ